MHQARLPPLRAIRLSRAFRGPLRGPEASQGRGGRSQGADVHDAAPCQDCLTGCRGPRRGCQTLHNRLDVPHALRAPGWLAPRSHANATALPLLPWRVLRPLLEELRPLTYGRRPQDQADAQRPVVDHPGPLARRRRCADPEHAASLHEWRHFESPGKAVSTPARPRWG